MKSQNHTIFYEQTTEQPLFVFLTGDVFQYWHSIRLKQTVLSLSENSYLPNYTHILDDGARGTAF